jgi:hypothetical protein
MVYLFGPRSTAPVRSRGLRGESGEVLGLRSHQDNPSIQVTRCASCRVSPRCWIHVAAALQVSILQGLVLSNMAWQYINRAFASWYQYPSSVQSVDSLNTTVINKLSLRQHDTE